MREGWGRSEGGVREEWGRSEGGVREEWGRSERVDITNLFTGTSAWVPTFWQWSRSVTCWFGSYWCVCLSFPSSSLFSSPPPSASLTLFVPPQLSIMLTFHIEGVPSCYNWLPLALLCQQYVPLHLFYSSYPLSSPFCLFLLIFGFFCSDPGCKGTWYVHSYRRVHQRMVCQPIQPLSFPLSFPLLLPPPSLCFFSRLSVTLPVSPYFSP